MLSCELSQISRNNYFEEHLRMTASKKRFQHRYFPLNFVNYSRAPIYEHLRIAASKKRFQDRYFHLNFVNYSRAPIYEYLWMAASKTPMRGFLFNKFVYLTIWGLSTVLERDSSTGVFRWDLCNFKESFFCRTVSSNHFSHECFSPLL